MRNEADGIGGTRTARTVGTGVGHPCRLTRYLGATVVSALVTSALREPVHTLPDSTPVAGPAATQADGVGMSLTRERSAPVCGEAAARRRVISAPRGPAATLARVMPCGQTASYVYGGRNKG